MEQESYYTEYDNQIQSRPVQMMKALLPFVHGTSQFPLAMMIQALEFRNTVSYFKENGRELAAFSLPPDTDQRNAILHTLRRFCTPKERETVDTLLNMISVLENFDKEDALGRFITGANGSVSP